MARVTLKDYNKFLIASLEACDAEKREMMARFSDVEAAQAELGDVRAEMANRAAEIHRLQQELSETRIVVNEEREKVARLMNENAVLQAQADDDRNKIGSLLRLRNEELTSRRTGGDIPVRVSVLRKAAQQSAAHHQNFPARSSIFSAQRGDNNTLSLRSLVTDTPFAHVDASSSAASGAVMTGAGDVSTAAPSGLVPTAAPPPGSTLVATLSREVATLKHLLDEQRKAYEAERAIRVQEERTRCQQQEETISRYSKTVDHLQRLLNDATRELVTYRHEAQIRERTMRGELEVLTVRVAEAERGLAAERSRKSADVQLAIETTNNRSHDIVASLRAKAREKEEAFVIEKGRLEHTVAHQKAQLESLTRRLAEEKKKRRRLVERHRFENEGMQTDINLMKQHLRAVEKKVYFQQQHGQHQQHHLSQHQLPPDMDHGDFGPHST